MLESFVLSYIDTVTDCTVFNDHHSVCESPSFLPTDLTLPSHEFYETDERLTLSIFDKGADPAQVSIQFEPRKVGILL